MHEFKNKIFYNILQFLLYIEKNRRREKETVKYYITLADRFVVIGFCLTKTAVEFQSSDPSSELDCHCFLTLFHFKRLLSFQISSATPQALAW